MQNTQYTGERCAHCGAAVAPGQNFCPACGSFLKGTQIQQKKKSTKTVVIALAAAWGVVLLLIIGVWAAAAPSLASHVQDFFRSRADRYRYNHGSQSQQIEPGDAGDWFDNEQPPDETVYQKDETAFFGDFAFTLKDVRPGSDYGIKDDADEQTVVVLLEVENTGDENVYIEGSRLMAYSGGDFATYEDSDISSSIYARSEAVPLDEDERLKLTPGQTQVVLLQYQFDLDEGDPAQRELHYWDPTYAQNPRVIFSLAQ
ncbi:zinc-ribbon domain-containing protein [Neobittarella massiliensis]|uniref:zinc-ribbon domain-containing protein n=1 Tax=Neobittarella massiliensis (ex Bilen et al. 2018) TaxID=2041842 RepID=UPI000CF735FD|nr:zinc-ribbon domain-containing protein [Neobittarella massiliensis]